MIIFGYAKWFIFTNEFMPTRFLHNSVNEWCARFKNKVIYMTIVESYTNVIICVYLLSFVFFLKNNHELNKLLRVDMIPRSIFENRVRTNSFV